MLENWPGGSYYDAVLIISKKFSILQAEELISSFSKHILYIFHFYEILKQRSFPRCGGWEVVGPTWLESRVWITGEDTDCIAPSTDRLLPLVKFWHLRSQYNQDDAAAHIASPSHSHVTCTASQAAAYYLSAFPSTENLHTSHLSPFTSNLTSFTFHLSPYTALL